MGGERGQGTVEWAAAVLLVAVLLVGAGVLIQAPWLPHRLACAVLVTCRGEAAALERAYGGEVAGYVRAFAPSLAYERETLTLPVDFRRCREHGCSDAAAAAGRDVWRSRAGRQATIFTRAIDRRAGGGALYLQYWLYYPDSTYQGDARAVDEAIGDGPLGLTPAGLLAHALAGYHADDWESVQVRVGRDGRVWSRASAHHGYAGRKRWPNLNELPVQPPVPDPGRWRLVPRARTAAWTPSTGWARVTRGSHAGHIVAGPGGDRRTEADGIALVPLETLPDADRITGFAIEPPWRKAVYHDPEATGT